jgi:hypothetical protein
MNEIKPLYRTINTRTHHVRHNSGQDSKHDRNTKNGMGKSMKRDTNRGLDFTPLYIFLISKIGKNYDDVYSEALSRIPKSEKEVIDHLFEDGQDKHFPYVRCGEHSYFSRLTVDKNGLIQKFYPDLTINDIYPSCDCHTHTFDGKVITNKSKNVYN